MTREPDFELLVDGRATRGYLARPAGDGPWPGVVVVQEWWGLNDNIRDTADRLANEGFVALAPDLYYGHTAHEPDEARKLAMGLEYPAAMRVLQTAVDYLIGLDSVAPKRVGLVGFCMGGGLTGTARRNCPAWGRPRPAMAVARRCRRRKQPRSTCRCWPSMAS